MWFSEVRCGGYQEKLDQLAFKKEKPLGAPFCSLPKVLGCRMPHRHFWGRHGLLWLLAAGRCPGCVLLSALGLWAPRGPMSP